MKEKVLLIKLHALGDLIMAAYTIKVLQKYGIKATLVTSNAYRKFFPNDSGIECIVPSDFIKSLLYRRVDANERDKIVEALYSKPKDYYPQLEKVSNSTKIKENYEAIIDLDGFPSSILLARHLRSKARRIIGWINRIQEDHYFRSIAEITYTDRHNFDNIRSLHSIDRYLHLVSNSLCLPTTSFPARPIFNYPSHAKDERGICIGVQLVTSSRIKNWQVANFSRLFENLEKSYPSMRILLFGNERNPEEIDAANQFTSKLTSSKATIRNLMDEGLCYFQQAEELNNCDLFIGCDSSWGHMAAAQRKLTFTIFGPTDNPEIYCPWPGKSETWISLYPPEDECRKCRWQNEKCLFETRRNKADKILCCLERITPDMVAKRIRRILKLEKMG